MAKEIYHFSDEAQLIQDVMQGDRLAWEYISKHYYGAILNFINNMVKDRETAEELVQDVFVNFWLKREAITVTTSLKAYLFRAARNHTLNFIKRRNFENDYHKGLAHSTQRSKNETEDTYRFDELEKKLYEAIENLPANCKEIFMLSRFEELTYKEISETLELPVRTVHYQIGLALKELRTKLKGYTDHHLIS